MSMATMWMIRGDGGRLYEKFRERKVAAIGWGQLAKEAKPGVTRNALIKMYKSLDPSIKDGTAISGASQVFRFVNEIKDADAVVTYSPANRVYSVGWFRGASEYHSEWVEESMALTRPVEWVSQEVDRDQLTPASKNSLGSTLTVFKVPPTARDELLALAAGEQVERKEEERVEAQLDDPLKGVEEIAFERIKDQINRLDWSDMQELVAGILRSMGYKTQVSPAGPDRGKDILASPDGFGFQQPRIVVEVKHREGRMGSAQIRSFLGGRHKDDRGLYVSTGGFSKDALYEADRATVPLTLWTLDELARTLMTNYPATDPQTKGMIPLKFFYVPAD
jgi:restriction system protein